MKSWILVLLIISIKMAANAQEGKWHISLNYNQLYVIEDTKFNTDEDFQLGTNGLSEIIEQSKKYSYGVGFNLSRMWEKFDVSFGANVTSKNLEQLRSCAACGILLPFEVDISSTSLEIPVTINFYPVNSDLQWYLGLGLNNMLSFETYDVIGVEESYGEDILVIAAIPQTGIKYHFSPVFIHGSILANYEIADIKWNGADVFVSRKESLNFDYWGFRLGIGIVL